MAGEHAEGAGKKGLQVAQGCQPGQRALRWVAASWTGEGALTRRAQLAVGACGLSTPRGLKRWRWGESGAMVSWAERRKAVGAGGSGPGWWATRAREERAGLKRTGPAGKEWWAVVLGFLSYSNFFSIPNSNKPNPNESKLEFGFTQALKQTKQCSSMMQQPSLNL